MIPTRFVTEYPLRCLELIDALEPIARRKDMLGSFALLAAASIFTIPHERMKARHPLSDLEREGALCAALAQLERQLFMQCVIWQGRPVGAWRFSRIRTDANRPNQWVDEGGHHPLNT